MSVRHQQGKLAEHLHPGEQCFFQFWNTSLLKVSHQQQLLSNPSASTHQQPIQMVQPLSVELPKMPQT